MDRQRELLLHQITALLSECTARPDGDEWLENMGRAVAAVRAGASLGISVEITRDANIRIGHYVKDNPDVGVGPIDLDRPRCQPWWQLGSDQPCTNNAVELGLCGMHAAELAEVLSTPRDNGDRR